MIEEALEDIAFRLWEAGYNTKEYIVFCGIGDNKKEIKKYLATAGELEVHNIMVELNNHLIIMSKDFIKTSLFKDISYSRFEYEMGKGIV